MIIELNNCDEWAEHRLRCLAVHNRLICFTGRTGFKWCRIELLKEDNFELHNGNLIIKLVDGFKTSLNLHHCDEITTI